MALRLALVKLASEAQLSDEVWPMRLPDGWETDSVRNRTSTVLQVAGFGATRGNNNKDLSPVLKETNLTVRLGEFS